MKRALIICLILMPFSYSMMAQPELNKRLQKQKAEFEAKIAAEEKYEELVQKAERAFENDEYADARSYYKEAIHYNPKNEAWLTSKINDLDILMAERVALISNSLPRLVEVDSSQDSILQPSEKVEETEQIVKSDFETVQPKEEVVPIREIDTLEIIKDVEKIEKSIAPDYQTEPLQKDTLTTLPKRVVYPKPSDPTPDANRNDYVDYPYGMTEEVFELKNHTIQRIVVVDSLETNVYKRVKHSWGGDFTFKNDLSISQRIWLDELEKYRVKFGK